jgi:hypothetical protein
LVGSVDCPWRIRFLATFGLPTTQRRQITFIQKTSHHWLVFVLGGHLASSSY